MNGEVALDRISVDIDRRNLPPLLYICIVKSLVHRFGAAFLAALCLVAVLSAPVAQRVDAFTGDKSEYLSSPSLKPFGYVSYPETKEQVLNDLSSSWDKEPYERHVAVQVAGQLLAAKLSQYILSTVSRLPRLRKANGMFPFHSFW
jgi:hypothetical protein